jgi:mono/diheme cytochrome c family protein
VKPFAASLLLLLAACSAPVAEQAAPPPKADEPVHEREHARQDASATTAAPAPAGDPVEGKRVARRVGCFGCHGDDLAGKKLWGEQGKFQMWSANITEHRDHYSDAEFERLLRTGKTHDGHRPLGMPINMYQHLSDREVRDIVAAVRAAPKVDNPGLKRTWMTPAWRKEQESWNDDVGDPVAAGAPTQPPTEKLALGKHLAMTSCPECHGADLNGYEGEDAPPLIVAKGYSLEQFRTLVRTGVTATGKESKTGLMSEIARNRLAPTLSDADIEALKAYLDSR